MERKDLKIILVSDFSDDMSIEKSLSMNQMYEDFTLDLYRDLLIQLGSSFDNKLMVRNSIKMMEFVISNCRKRTDHIDMTNTILKAEKDHISYLFESIANNLKNFCKDEIEIVIIFGYVDVVEFGKVFGKDSIMCIDIDDSYNGIIPRSLYPKCENLRKYQNMISKVIEFLEVE